MESKADNEFTSLQQAQRAWADAQSQRKQSELRDYPANVQWRERSERSKDDAATLALIAQAEALTKIAEVLEEILDDAIAQRIGQNEDLLNDLGMHNDTR